MEITEAQQILKNALNVAVQKGCYHIDDVALIIEALKIIENLQNSITGTNQSKDVI